MRRRLEGSSAGSAEAAASVSASASAVSEADEAWVEWVAWVACVVVCVACGGRLARDRLKPSHGLEQRYAAGNDEAVISLRLSCD